MEILVKGVYEEAWGSLVTVATTQVPEPLDVSQGGARKDKGSSNGAVWASSQPWGVGRLRTQAGCWEHWVIPTSHRPSSGTEASLRSGWSTALSKHGLST